MSSERSNKENIDWSQVRSVDVKEALRLQKENNFVILDVRPEAEFKEVTLTSVSFHFLAD